MMENLKEKIKDIIYTWNLRLVPGSLIDRIEFLFTAETTALRERVSFLEAALNEAEINLKNEREQARLREIDFSNTLIELIKATARAERVELALAQVQAERDVAVADNAALFCTDEDYLCKLCEADWINARPAKCRKNFHPGQAMLDRIKELERLITYILNLNNNHYSPNGILTAMDRDGWFEQARAARKG
jgi:hypothetical protein